MRRVVVLAVVLAASGCGPRGIRGSFPGPEPLWTETGGTFCRRCGGGPRVEVWARGRTPHGTALLHVETSACVAGLETHVGGDGNATRAALVYEHGERGTPGSATRHEAVDGTMVLQRCDASDDAAFADVSFELELEGGGSVEGRIAAPLDLDAGFE